MSILIFGYYRLHVNVIIEIVFVRFEYPNWTKHIVATITSKLMHVQLTIDY